MLDSDSDSDSDVDARSPNQLSAYQEIMSEPVWRPEKPRARPPPARNADFVTGVAPMAAHARMDCLRHLAAASVACCSNASIASAFP